jgi:hypothetical protein
MCAFLIFLVVGVIVGINWQVTTASELDRTENLIIKFSRFLAWGTSVQFEEFIKSMDELPTANKRIFCDGIAGPMCLESSRFLSPDAITFCRDLADACLK